MNDIDTLIRDRLAAAATFEVAADPPRVRDSVARRLRRARRRRRAAAALCVIAVAGVGAGVVVAFDQDQGADVTVQVADQPEEGASNVTAERGADEVLPEPGSTDMHATTPTAAQPRFAPALGWDVVQVESVATASNIELGPSTRSGDAPWDTVERLEDGDVVLFAFFMPAGEKAVVDAAFPPGELPLSIDDALPTGLEGQPDDVTDEGLQVQVNGWNITLHVFYGGTAPSAAARAAAQEQLARLEVPPRVAS